MENVKPSEIVDVVQRYKAYIAGMCRRFYIVGGTSEDLFEEGVIGLLEACKSFNGDNLFDEGFDAFAKLCIKRQIYDAIKKSNTQKNKALNEAISLVRTDEFGDEFSSLDIMFDRNNINDPLEIFLDKEKFDERMKICEENLSKYEKIVLEHYLEGKKQSEIAKDLNQSVKSIDNTIQRIKSKLK